MGRSAGMPARAAVVEDNATPLVHFNVVGVGVGFKASPLGNHLLLHDGGIGEASLSDLLRAYASRPSPMDFSW
jgi:hypothetical protein